MRKLVVAAILLSAPPALALDGYQDRRGLFAGLGFGGGFVAPAAEGADNEVGERLMLRLGGGVAENITLDVSMDFLFVPDIDARTISFWGGGSFYLVPQAFVRAAVGIANFSREVGPAGGVSDISKAGLGLFVGAGFEMFVNSELAAGFTLGFERQQFDDDQSLNVVSGLIGISWY